MKVREKLGRILKGSLKADSSQKNSKAVSKAFERIKEEARDEKCAAKLFDRAIVDVLTSQHRSVFWGDRLLTLDKSAGFMSDPVFHSAYMAIRGSHEYDLYDSPHTIAWRLHTLVWAAGTGLNVEGDFVECGVFKGDMAWFVSQNVDLRSKNKHFYLYDTFDGFSEKYSSKEDFPECPELFDITDKQYRNPELYPYVRDRFKDRQDISVIKGTVPDVLPETAPKKIAFLHIDLNSPAAEIGALELLFPRVTPGGVVVFDDYGWKVFHRQKEAEDEFMRKLGYQILELPTGQGMVVKR